MIDPGWLAWDEAEARLTAAISERMLDLARLPSGGALLDLATGEPALRALRRLGPDGVVVGCDPAADRLGVEDRASDACC